MSMLGMHKQIKTHIILTVTVSLVKNIECNATILFVQIQIVKRTIEEVYTPCKFKAKCKFFANIMYIHVPISMFRLLEMTLN